MSRHLLLSFRFLSPWFHGRGDEGAPEWPPSPLRAFQAVVAAAGRAGSLDSTRTALVWLERRDAPLIIASEGVESAVGYRLSVPHNAMDIVGRQWNRGEEGNASEHRTMKDVRPHSLPEEAVVHYAWRLDADESATPALIAAARGVVALGWGVDLVVGNGAVVEGRQLSEYTASLKVWEPRSDGQWTLRVPTEGTLVDLDRRHAEFLARNSFADPTLRPPAPLSTFSRMSYARSDQGRIVSVAGFTLMGVQSDNLRAFDVARRGMAVAGMLRHAVRTAAVRAGWDEARIRASVLGHGNTGEARLLLVPVPSVEPREGSGLTVSAVRRVMVFSTNERCGDTEWAARVLGGMALIDEKTGKEQAVLAAAARGDRVLARYREESRAWTTVTPVVLPGYDDVGGVRKRLRNAKGSDEQKLLLDRLMKRRDALVRKALQHAGLGDELALSAQIDLRETGFIAGVEHAARYAVPSHLAGSPRFHVRLTFPVKVAGPLCVGRGRFSGLGLFTPVRD